MDMFRHRRAHETLTYLLILASLRPFLMRPFEITCTVYWLAGGRVMGYRAGFFV